MAEPGNKKIFVKIKWHQQAVCLLLETIFESVLYPKREQLKLTKPWHPLEHWSRSQVISINLLQVGQPLSVFTFPALTAMMEVVRISEQNKEELKNFMHFFTWSKPSKVLLHNAPMGNRGLEEIQFFSNLSLWNYVYFS